MSDVNYLTAEGLQRIQDELAHLKDTSRPQLAMRLRAAVQMGDLSENADYISAKEEQGFLEGRIQELERILKNVVVIDETRTGREVVDIGAHVTVQESNYPPDEYLVVGPKEADPYKGRISHESPIGRALLGRKVGDEIVAETPGGHVHLKIIEIK
jgi:transcription elongation factor GreA